MFSSKLAACAAVSGCSYELELAKPEILSIYGAKNFGEFEKKSLVLAVVSSCLDVLATILAFSGDHSIQVAGLLISILSLIVRLFQRGPLEMQIGTKVSDPEINGELENLRGDSECNQRDDT